MPDSPADQLTAAAKLLRERATAAIHGGRTTWRLGHTLGTKTPVVLDDQDKPTVLIETYAERLERVNSYLTLVGPATGLALADWLESAAEDVALVGPDFLAVRVARQLLGQVTE